MAEPPWIVTHYAVLNTCIVHYLSYRDKEVGWLDCLTLQAALQEQCYITGPGNYLGIALFSKTCLPMNAENTIVKIAGDCIKHDWVLGFDSPTWLKPAIKHAAGMDLTFLEKLRICAHFVKALRTSSIEVYDTVITWCLSELFKESYPMVSLAASKWRARISELELFENYSGDGKSPLCFHFLKNTLE